MEYKWWKDSVFFGKEKNKTSLEKEIEAIETMGYRYKKKEQTSVFPLWHENYFSAVTQVALDNIAEHQRIIDNRIITYNMVVPPDAVIHGTGDHRVTYAGDEDNDD